MKNILLRHGEIYTHNGILYNGDLLISDGKISEIGVNITKEDAETIDLNGKKVVPGFIDIHIHGGVGYDVMDASYEALNSISVHLARHGVTSFCATTMTMDVQNIQSALKNINDTMKKGTDGAQILGAYVEGPFISKEHKGAQDERHILEPDINIMEKLIEASNNSIKVVALAPEKDANGDFVKYVTRENIRVSLGHTNATYEEMKNAADHGATLAVHTYNGMKGFKHREPGALGEVFLDDRIYGELICDFVHSHPASVEILIKIKGVEKIILISDAMLACGLGDGEYVFGGQKVIVDKGIARIENGSLAGSTLTLDKAVANITKLGIPLSEAIKMASINPAKTIGIDAKGSIDIGKDADIVVLDNDLAVNMTIVNGKTVYKK
ncbi:N-acetylglucosamine-6-phosphate deacetylase [Thermoanaerobacterium thermosaccharolyticum]|uniref:N-acetylglucosamine-6-phosphate deacetylase n=1 Tax=Thermoanaerobacterium thermosaccharolyticum TaxID=1517 RepID=A0A231VAX1_THETR|nr:N-acetylglucosamine-6-phosphate deacetylase [Thermoanaerobacterium thermosaccharolyticum]AST56602.1 N-acetylglucosamine-6-phosphate deacetylase [Thermoanaerobacterium thermosaccharolyticum]OXT05318.1 N-acetylglucosamine-6-phosphate deacetylase [Thermoanaerobacterium thermosaccharolyticum]